MPIFDVVLDKSGNHIFYQHGINCGSINKELKFKMSRTTQYCLIELKEIASYMRSINAKEEIDGLKIINKINHKYVYKIHRHNWKIAELHICYPPTCGLLFSDYGTGWSVNEIEEIIKTINKKRIYRIENISWKKCGF